MEVGKIGGVVYVETLGRSILGKVFIPDSKITRKFLEYFRLTLKERHLEMRSKKGSDKKNLGIIRNYIKNFSKIEHTKYFYGSHVVDECYEIPGFFVSQKYLGRIPDSWDLKKKENTPLDCQKPESEVIEEKEIRRENVIYPTTPLNVSDLGVTGKAKEEALLRELGKKKRHISHAKPEVENEEVTEQNTDVKLVSEVKRYLGMLYTAALLPKICKYTIEDLILTNSDLEKTHEKKGVLDERYNRHCIKVLERFGHDILGKEYNPEIIYSSKHIKMNSDLRTIISKAQDYFEQQGYPN